MHTKTEEILSLADQGYSKRGIAAELGICFKSVRKVLDSRENAALIPERQTIPNLPAGDLPAASIIDFMCQRFEKRLERANAVQWAPTHIPFKGPFAIMVFGDMHLDDNGTNWPLLNRHLDIAGRKDIPIASIHMGDMLNNWPKGGKLGGLYASQDTSKDTGYKLLRHVICERDIFWLYWLGGNHDKFNEELLTIAQEMANQAKRPFDIHYWRFQTELVLPDGQRIKIDSAHNYKGSSMWDRNVGLKKAAIIGEMPDVVLAGDHHTWSIGSDEFAERGKTVHFARARGYKFIDSYAFENQFASQKNGAALLLVVDPRRDVDNQITVWKDPEHGVDYLEMLLTAAE